MELQLYRGKINSINNKIVKIYANNVNEDTGEISEEVLNQLNDLELTKQELQTVIALSYFDFDSLIKSIENNPIMLEAKRLNELKKKYEKTKDGFKNLLTKVVNEGEKIDSDLYSISWRKSSTVEIDELANMKQLKEQYPDLVEIEYKLLKTEVKKLAKEGKPLPKDLTIVEKQNIQIK